jgi:hypothetical protein
MPESGRNGNGVTNLHRPRFLFNLHFARTGGDEVNLFGFGMIMFQRATADRNSGLGEALQLDAGVAMGEKLADLRTILGGEGGNGFDVRNIHGLNEHGKPPNFKFQAQETFHAPKRKSGIEGLILELLWSLDAWFLELFPVAAKIATGRSKEFLFVFPRKAA